MVKRRELSQLGSPEALVEAVQASRPRSTRRATHDHGPVSEVVRTAEHAGHQIVIRTTYSAEVDGRPITGHLGVTDDGQVHYHAVPNLSFASALDMVRKLIDAFPDDFPPAEPCPEPCDEDHDHHRGHDHGGGH